MRLNVNGIVNHAGHEKQCAGGQNRIRFGKTRGEDNESQNERRIDCRTTKQRSWLSVPTVFPWSRHEADSRCQAPSKDYEYDSENMRNNGGESQLHRHSHVSRIMNYFLFCLSDGQ